jgi:hypothetical protein
MFCHPMYFSFVFFYIPYISLPYVAPCLKEKSSVDFSGFFVCDYLCASPTDVGVGWN